MILGIRNLTSVPPAFEGSDLSDGRGWISWLISIIVSRHTSPLQNENSILEMDGQMDPFETFSQEFIL